MNDFTDNVIVGFKPSCLYSDLPKTPLELPTKLQIKLFR